MKCARVYRHLCENLDGNLRSARCLQIRKHLSACPECRRFLGSLKKTVGIYRALPCPELRPSARARFHASIEKLRFSPAPRRLRR